jgi:hypothetical protein
MKYFRLSLLTSEHDKSTNLTAVEHHVDHDIQVEIFSKGSQKEIMTLVRTIESSYQETQENEKPHHSFWPW